MTFKEFELGGYLFDKTRSTSRCLTLFWQVHMEAVALDSEIHGIPLLDFKFLKRHALYREQSSGSTSSHVLVERLEYLNPNLPCTSDEDEFSSCILVPIKHRSRSHALQTHSEQNSQTYAKK